MLVASGDPQGRGEEWAALTHSPVSPEDSNNKVYELKQKTQHTLSGFSLHTCKPHPSGRAPFLAPISPHADTSTELKTDALLDAESQMYKHPRRLHSPRAEIPTRPEGC